MGDMSTRAPAPALAVAAALGTVYLLWGSTYLGIRVAIDDVPALLMASIRFLVAGVLLYAVAGRGMSKAERPSGRHWRDAAIIGILLLGVGNGGVTLAELAVPTGIVALLVATVPLWIALIARLVLREPLSRTAAISLAVGFGGVAILIGPGRSGSASLLGMLLVLIAPLAWSVGSLYGRAAATPPRPLVGVAMQLLCAGAALLVVAVLGGDLGRVHANALHPRPLLAMLYLITFGSVVGYTAYAWLLQNAPIALVSTYAYVNPVVAVILGRIVLGESIGPATLAGGGVIAVAVALVVAAGARDRRRASGRGDDPLPLEAAPAQIEAARR